MAQNQGALSRRGALRTISATTGLSVVSGFATAGPGDSVLRNIGVANATGRSKVKQAAETVVREFNFDALTVRITEDDLDGLKSDSDIRYTEQNGNVWAQSHDVSYGIYQTNAIETIRNCYRAEYVDVAVVDTGIEPNHPDLEPHMGAGTYSMQSQDSPPGWADDTGHGTHCAGIIGAIDNRQGVLGAAPRATMHAVKVLDDSGAGTVSHAAAGIEDVVTKGWQVAVLPFAGQQNSSLLADACSYASNNNVFLAAAAGNTGECTDCVAYPARFSECVAVSAVDGSGTLAEFSATGSQIEFAAPGVDIISLHTSGKKHLSGTSMACSFVGAAGAILMGEGYSATQARQQLQTTARDLGLPSNQQGYGMIDLKAALGI